MKAHRGLVPLLLALLVAGGAFVARAQTIPALPNASAAVPGSSAPLTRQEGRPFVVKNIETDSLPADPQLAAAVRLGYNVATQTRQYAALYVGNELACTSCHLNGGQQENAIPWVGIGPQFPERDPRSGQVITLEDRIRECFLRSMNGIAPPPGAEQLVAVAAYINWLSEGWPAGQNPPWRHQDKIPTEHLIPIDQLQPEHGRALYERECLACHGPGGLGDSAPPLAGPQSFNDGAGLARVYTLAGFVRHVMPLTLPGSLSDEEAQQLAAYLDSLPRPGYRGKAHDFPDGQVPADAVYYPQRYPQNPLRQ